jgi:hypothetical protein
MERLSITGQMNRTAEHSALRLRTSRVCFFAQSSVLLLDKVAFHSAKAGKAYADKSGVKVLFVRAYSSWLNPVEGELSVAKRMAYVLGSKDEFFAPVISFFADR